MPHMRLAAAAFVALLASPAALHAQDTTPRGVTVGLSYDPSTRPGVAILPIAGPSGDSLRAIIERDLDYADRYTLVSLDATDPRSFRVAGSGGTSGGLNYPLFAQLGAIAVVQVTATPTGLHVALHDVAKQAVRTVDEFTLPATMNRDWRLAVHGASDEIERWITGQRGIAQTRIAFVHGASIRIVDSDGAELESVPVQGNAMSPQWHPNGSLLTYSTYGASSRIIVHDLRTGRSRVLTNATPTNTNLTPVWSTDGSSIVYSHAGEYGSDLFLVPAEGDAPARRISVGRGTDNAQPTFSPDGRRIAFTSGRSGHPEIYIMDADGTNVDLLTSFDFGDQNYRSDADWSPDGRLVAFQSRFAGRFQLMTISLRDRSTKLLTSEGENEQPAWAPDGRHLVFTSTRGGTRQLWVLDAESGRMRQLTRLSGAARLAAWSPRLGGAARQ